MSGKTYLIGGLIAVVFATLGTVYFYPIITDTELCGVRGNSHPYENLTETHYFNSTFSAIGRYYCEQDAEIDRETCLNTKDNTDGCYWCAKLSGTKKTCYVIEDPEPPTITLSSLDSKNIIDVGLDKTQGVKLNLIKNGLTHKVLEIQIERNISAQDIGLLLKNTNFDANKTSGTLKKLEMVEDSVDVYEELCNPYNVTENITEYTIDNCTEVLNQTVIRLKPVWQEVNLKLSNATTTKNLRTYDILSKGTYRYSFDVPIVKKGNYRGNTGEIQLAIDDLLLTDRQNSSRWNETVTYYRAINSNSSAGTFDSLFLINGSLGVFNTTCWINATHSPTDSVVAYLYYSSDDEIYVVDSGEVAEIPFYCERRGKLTQNNSLSNLWTKNVTTVVGFENNDSNLHDLIGNYSFNRSGNVTVTTGFFGDYALKLNTDIDCYSNLTFQIDATFTAYVWVKYNSINNYIFGAKNTADNDDDAFLVFSPFNGTSIQFAKRGTSTASIWSANITGIADYIQVVARVNGTVPNQRMYLYINGELEASHSIGTSDNPTDKFGFCRMHLGPQDSFQGWISHFEFYNVWGMPGDVIKRRYDYERSTLGAEQEVSPTERTNVIQYLEAIYWDSDEVDYSLNVSVVNLGNNSRKFNITVDNNFNTSSYIELGTINVSTSKSFVFTNTTVVRGISDVTFNMTEPNVTDGTHYFYGNTIGMFIPGQIGAAIAFAKNVRILKKGGML